MKIKKKSILIIGGTGFLGFSLAKQCIRKNFSTFSISKFKPNKNRKLSKVKYLFLDIKNFKKLKEKLQKYKFDYVVNCGGYVEHKNKKEIYNNHYKGCVNLFNFFKDKKLSLFIQIGSSSEYGNVKVPHKESYLGRPKGIYGKIKLNATNFLIEKFYKNKFPVVIVRFYQLYGPFQDYNRFIPQLIKASVTKSLFFTSPGNQFRDFLHVDDAINALFKLILSRNLSGQIFNIGYGKAYKLKKIMNIIKKKNNFLKPIYNNSIFRKDEIIKVYPSIKKAKKLIGWSPKISITKGLGTTNKFYTKILKK